MTEKPILFNTEMVRAILDGRKTQTRRICRIRSIIDFRLIDHAKCITVEFPKANYKGPCANFLDEKGEYLGAAQAPAQPGDVLWVRETWCQPPISPGGNTRIPGRYYYKADPEMRPEGWRGNWKPSIHMPRKAARLFLRVTAVRVERLKDITEAGAIAEGFTEDPLEDGKTNVSFMCSVDCLQGTARGKFALLWNKTVRREDADKYGWSANPWVWVIEFEKMEG